jgi:SMC interacting uncharacterized protein involved in chromosome segregation
VPPTWNGPFTESLNAKYATPSQGGAQCFEARAERKLAQAEIDTIARLKAKNQEIDKKVHQDLKVTTEVTLTAKIKSEIDAEMAKFKASFNQLNAKLKSQPAAH